MVRTAQDTVAPRPNIDAEASITIRRGNPADIDTFLLGLVLRGIIPMNLFRDNPTLGDFPVEAGRLRETLGLPARLGLDLDLQINVL